MLENKLSPSKQKFVHQREDSFFSIKSCLIQTLSDPIWKSNELTPLQSVPESLIPHPVLSLFPQLGSRRDWLLVHSLIQNEKLIFRDTESQYFSLNIHACALFCCSTENLCKDRLSRSEGVGTSSATQVTPSQPWGVWVLRLGWQVPPHRGAGPRAENGTSMLFILSLIFLGKIERTVFQHKETFPHRVVSKSQSTPDSESTSCSVDRTASPPLRTFFQKGSFRRSFTPVCSLTCSQFPSLRYLGVQDKL